MDILAEEPSKRVPWTVPTDGDGILTYRGHEYVWRRGYVRFKPGYANWDVSN